MEKKLNIAYFYNRPGWAFEFEAINYKKFSSHNVIIMLESDFDNLDYNIDVAVLPSCLHYNLIINQQRLEDLRKKKIKLVVQCNSHKELDYDVPNADLIIPSSKKLYIELIKKYPKTKVSYQPHFVDTNFFKPEYNYNNFTVGWVGDLKNPFKRSHLINQIKYPIKIKSDFLKSQKENVLQQDMPSYYNTIDVLLVLSESEGTPMPLLEALSCGKIVITTDVGIAREFLHPFYIINARNENEIVKQVNDKLDYLKNHVNLQKNASKKFVKIIEKRFDWKNNVRKLDTLYSSLNNKKTIPQVFYSPEPNHCYLQELSKHINIKFENNIAKIKDISYPVILWNPYGYLVAPKLHWKKDIYEYRRRQGKATYILERGALPSSIFLDRWGFLANSQSYQSEKWDKPLSEKEKKLVIKYIKNFISSDTTLEPQNNNRISRAEFYKSLDLASNHKIVFVPMQVCKDTVIQLFGGWIGKMENLEPLLRQIAIENPKITFLVKNHPVERNYKVSASKNIKIVDNYHYKDCIAYSDAILTINSSVGLQALMWSKTVITLGKCFYNFPLLTKKANSKEEIVKYIKQNSSPITEKVRRLIFYLRFMFYSYCEMEKTGNNASKPLVMKNVRYEHKNTGYLEGKFEPEAIIKDYKSTETISVLIPAFNREKWVEQSLRSILNQTYKDLDIIIYDDGSTDNTLNICKKLAEEDNRIRIIEGKENKGVAEARNILLNNCQTKYAVWHDTDDFSNIRRIELQYEEMKKKERLIFGTWDNLSYHPGEWKEEPKIQTRPKPRPKGFATLMFPVKKEINFDPNKKLGGEDWDWIEKMRRRYHEILIPQRVYYINFHLDKIGQWKKVLTQFPGIDMTKMSYQEMQEFYRKHTGKDIKDGEE